MIFRISLVAVCCSSCLFRLVEQPHVLDGDDGLVGEGLKELGLRVGEAAGPLSHDDDHAHGRPLAQEGHADEAPPAARLRQRMRVLGILHHVFDVHDGAAQDDAPRRLFATRPNRVHLLDDPQRLRRVVVVGRDVNLLTVEPADEAIQPIAQAHGAPYDRVEDGLDIGRRARDDAQDLAGRRLLLQRLTQGARDLRI